MNFTSQIGTTEAQSKQLLALGLKAETADMRYQIHYLDLGGILKECTPTLEPNPPINNDENIPAWSLHRLIVLSGMGIIESTTDNLYDKVIQYIEYLIKCGDFNKEYLEE